MSKLRFVALAVFGLIALAIGCGDVQKAKEDAATPVYDATPVNDDGSVPGTDAGVDAATSSACVLDQSTLDNCTL